MRINEFAKHFIDDCEIRIIEKMNICEMPHYEIIKEEKAKYFKENEFDSDYIYRIRDFKATEKGFDIYVIQA